MYGSMEYIIGRIKEEYENVGLDERKTVMAAAHGILKAIAGYVPNKLYTAAELLELFDTMYAIYWQEELKEGLTCWTESDMQGNQPGHRPS